MTEANEKIVKTSTKKRGSSIRRSITAGNCVVCSTNIDRISKVIMYQTKLPSVISNLITKYFEEKDQYIGYVLLHKKSRRCTHVACIKCWEHILHHALTNGNIFIDCVHAKCTQFIHISKIDLSVIC